MKKLDNARTASEQIDKDRQKKTGEVFTPPELTNLLLDQLPEDLFEPGKTFLEPAAGDGNMVIEVLKRKMAYGCSPTEALQDMFAIEYMKDNYEAMIKRVLNLVGDTKEHRTIIDHNFAYANTLDENDTSDGRCFPNWLRQQSTLDAFFE